MNRLSPFLLLALLAAPACAQRSSVPDLLKRAFTPPASKQLFAYDFEEVSTGGSADKQVRSTTRGHIDPSRKKGDRAIITFTEQTGDKPADPKKIDERYERGADGAIFCDGLSEKDVTNVADKGSSPAGRLFTFTPKAPPGADGTMKDITKKMAGEAIVDEATATLRSYNAVLTRTHNVMLVFDIKSAAMKATCAQAPNGRAYRARMEFSLSGAGMGQSIVINSVQTISNIAPVGPAG